jgi:hypothetical protein
MEGLDMFCERCGTRYASEETARMAAPLARRLLEAVGVVESPPKHAGNDPFLRFCLACRGYSCPSCWNEDAGFCQTCVPLPEPVIAVEFVPIVHPIPVVDPIPAIFAFAGEPTVDEPTLMVAAIDEDEAQAFEPVAAQAEPVAAFEPEPIAAFEAPLAAPEPIRAEFAVAEPEPIVAEPEPIAAELAAESVRRIRAGRRRARGRSRIVLRTSEVELPAEAVPEVAPLLSEDVPTLPAFTLDEASFTEPEPDVQWDWTFEPALDVQPDLALAAADEPAEQAAEGARGADTVVPGLVEPASLPPAPVFRPLEPMGPFLPPPPPAAFAPLARMDFDLPSAPPAFLIAQQPQVSVARPHLPAGLFDGPGPSIRPCSTCDLPVSARARFCRRCGSAQG